MSGNTTTQSPPPDLALREWLDVVLPVMGFGLLLVLFVMFFNYFITSWNKFRCCDSCFSKIKQICCKNSVTNDSDEGHENPTVVNDDLPPTYSLAGLGRSSSEIFRVIPDDVSDVVSCWNRPESENSDKLPSYFEIMEEKKHEPKAGSSIEHPDELPKASPNDSNIVEENDEEIRSPHSPIETSQEIESDHEPPSYDSVLT